MASNNSPAEKAKELVVNLFKQIQFAAYPYPSKAQIAAKQCALICVDEMLQNEPKETFVWIQYKAVLRKNNRIEYLEQVKEEINKL
jgi:Pyruvate/2-oxoacid:ferredoxin oxidoreductase delta subunit